MASTRSPSLLTTRQIAAHYATTPKTIYDWLYRRPENLPPPVRFPNGRLRGWRPEDVDAYDAKYAPTTD